MKIPFLPISLFAALVLGACNTAPRTAEGKADIQANATVAFAKAQHEDPSLYNIFRAAKGYAIFPSIGKGAVGIGGAYGKGVLYEDGEFAGYCDVSQGSIGFQLGGQSYTELIAFETNDSLNLFKTGNLAFDAQASAVAVKAGAGTNAKYSYGVAVYTMNESGLMFDASIGGQKFSYQAK